MNLVGPTRHFYDTLVPKTPWENVEFRKWCLAKADSDKAFADELWIMCARDCLFFLNAFGWLLEPRNKSSWQQSRPFGDAKEIPFISRPYQDDAILSMQEDLGKKDILIKKSREMGATWMAMYLFDWAWRFHDQQHFGIVSKDEDSVDKAGDPSCLMAKLDFIDKHLPKFLQPGGNSNRFRRRSHTDHIIENLMNGSTIVGCACTGEMFRGGRARAVWMDEMHSWPEGGDTAAMASTQHVTACRIMCSTPNGQRGQSGQFHDIAMNPHRNMKILELPWKLDQDKAAGLYTSQGNTLKIIDKMYPYTTDYPFVLDGKTRSPYYDYECQRAGATPRSIAAELDMDFGGSTNRFFDPAVIFTANCKVRNPDLTVRLMKVEDEWISSLIEDKHGDIELWIPEHLEVKVEDSGIVRIPRGRRFSIGCDISQGIGGASSSYSSSVILDCASGEQIGEWRANKMMPPEFASFANILGMVFNYAVLCPEVTGVGQQFLAKILQLGYPNMWFRPQSKDAVYAGMSRKVGYDNKDGGLVILGELQRAIQTGLISIRSRRIIQECERYFVDERGKLKHPLVGKGRQDAPEQSHGDSAIACAAAWWAIREDPDPVVHPQEREPPVGSFAWRTRQREGQKRTCSYWDPFEDRKQSAYAYGDA